MRIHYFSVALTMALSAFVLVSCDRGADGCSAEATSCRARISALANVLSGSYRKYHAELEDIFNEISVMTNADDRLVYFRVLSREMTAFDFSKSSLGEREVLSGKYTQPFYGLAQCMVRDGATAQEIGDLIISAFAKFNELCFPTATTKYLESDQSYDARQQRAYVRGLRAQWGNDTLVWESVFIPNVFRCFSTDAEDRFLVRWHEAFGCRVKNHPEYQENRAD